MRFIQSGISAVRFENIVKVSVAQAWRCHSDTNAIFRATLSKSCLLPILEVDVVLSMRLRASFTVRYLVIGVVTSLHNGHEITIIYLNKSGLPSQVFLPCSFIQIHQLNCSDLRFPAVDLGRRCCGRKSMIWRFSSTSSIQSDCVWVDLLMGQGALAICWLRYGLGMGVGVRTGAYSSVGVITARGFWFLSLFLVSGFTPLCPLLVSVWGFEFTLEDFPCHFVSWVDFFVF